MLASFVSGFADISLGQLALIAVMALIIKRTLRY